MKAHLEPRTLNVDLLTEEMWESECREKGLEH